MQAGQTALHHAAYKGHDGVVERLIELGAAIDTKDKVSGARRPSPRVMSLEGTEGPKSKSAPLGPIRLNLKLLQCCKGPVFFRFFGRFGRDFEISRRFHWGVSVKMSVSQSRTFRCVIRLG